MTDNDVIKYDFEYIQDPDTQKDDSDITNALGYPKDWYKIPKQEQQETEPENYQITLEELEKIRKEAYDDGFLEGKNDGFNTGHDEGYKEGFTKGETEGFAKGQAEGLKNGTEIVSEQAARFCKYANHLVNPIGELDEELSSELVYLASRLARAFIKEELHYSTNYLEKSIAEAFKLLPAISPDISIQLNPSEVDLVKNSLMLKDVTIQPNPELKNGDLVVSSGMSSIDIRLEDRIDSFLKEFLAINSDKNKLASHNNGYEEEHSFDNIKPQNSEIKNIEEVQPTTPNDEDLEQQEIKPKPLKEGGISRAR
ncbi:MAG: FliH/SctL family protein [Succinivibrionaceae bacterium]